ncbi:MAG: hypothetical protein A3J47_00635 [Candidatus Yanofskybacteria bacterium RIFCSPHIGHO2_02_FULL_43_22]|uniref:Uncharacterized protein n=1 Tax=Candidatus Yanofskybacteria bacterium RIFCSPHIGHO2_02_FULL_43_22 TaxID=1802681 RepID=A0A1F8FPY9_9BACT|nr:MAG: hypothetical protein A3J47_00635 [Candidatus Yanofskybacteria bacterium RIFCSPHIGHO2_02_FULL_43_22]
MKAQLITYSYTEHEDDFHKGLKTWQESKKAIIIPELNVLVVEWGRRVHFFEMKGLDGKFELDYYPENYEVELPKKTFEVIRELDVDDEVARTALWLAQNHDRLQAQQTCWKAALTQ